MSRWSTDVNCSQLFAMETIYRNHARSITQTYVWWTADKNEAHGEVNLTSGMARGSGNRKQISITHCSKLVPGKLFSITKPQASAGRRPQASGKGQGEHWNATQTKLTIQNSTNQLSTSLQYFCLQRSANMWHVVWKSSCQQSHPEPQTKLYQINAISKLTHFTEWRLDGCLFNS